MLIDNLEFIEDPEFSQHTFFKDEMYIMTVDSEQKESKDITKFDGGTVTLYTPQKYNPNYRTSLPNVGVVRKAVGVDCKFKEGDSVICSHFAFYNEQRNSIHFTEENGVKLYQVTNLSIIAGVVDGKLVPQDEVILCEPVVGKLLKTSLELTDEMVDVRRDVALISIVPEKYKDKYKVGEYLFLNEGADYMFDFNGKTYISVELFLDGAIMTGPDLDYQPAVLWRHKKDHNKETDVLS